MTLWLEVDVEIRCCKIPSDSRQVGVSSVTTEFDRIEMFPILKGKYYHTMFLKVLFPSITSHC